MHIIPPHRFPLRLAALLIICFSMIGQGCGTQEEGSSKPDLTFSAVSYSPSDPQVGDVVTMKVTVYNDGDSTSTRCSLRYTFQGSAYDVPLSSISSGSTTNLEFDLQSSSTGAYAITLTIDPKDDCDESREGNNGRTKSVTWKDTEIGDLYTEQTDVTDASLLKGESAEVSFSVRFDAASGITGTRTVEYRISRSGSSAAISSGSIKIAANSTSKKIVQFTDPDASGVQAYTIRIDPGDKQTESDETNNDSTFDISWSASG